MHSFSGNTDRCLPPGTPLTHGFECWMLLLYVEVCKLAGKKTLGVLLFFFSLSFFSPQSSICKSLCKCEQLISCIHEFTSPMKQGFVILKQVLIQNCSQIEKVLKKWSRWRSWEVHKPSSGKINFIWRSWEQVSASSFHRPCPALICLSYFQVESDMEIRSLPGQALLSFTCRPSAVCQRALSSIRMF